MKKILLSLLAVSSLALAASACNNGSGGSAAPDPNAKPAAATPSAAAATPSAKPAASANKPSGGGW